MAAKLTRLTHNVALQLHLVAESCTICSSRSRRPVWKLLDTPSYPENAFLRFCTLTVPELRLVETQSVRCKVNQLHKNYNV